MMDEDWDDIRANLVGCTCEHEPEEHGWMSCEVEDCPCEGAWEE